MIKSKNVLTLSLPQTHNKNDYIHFHSRHNDKIKIGLIIGFYLRALRIYSPQHLDEEFKYIEYFFKSLAYPKFFILNARKKKLSVFLIK